jgi:uncharacterized membrane protein
MSLIKRVMLYAMGAFYVFAGVNHFLDPEFYLPMMPPYLPAHHFLIALSGVAEIACGIGVVIPRTRVLAAWATVALLPIGGASEGLGALNFVRLAFQPVLIAWAWWFTRPDPPRAGAQEHASHLAG